MCVTRGLLPHLAGRIDAARASLHSLSVEVHEDDKSYNAPASIFESTAHCLHGLLHANGYGHLIRVNGRDGAAMTATAMSAAAEKEGDAGEAPGGRRMRVRVHRHIPPVTRHTGMPPACISMLACRLEEIPMRSSMPRRARRARRAAVRLQLRQLRRRRRLGPPVTLPVTCCCVSVCLCAPGRGGSQHSMDGPRRSDRKRTQTEFLGATEAGRDRDKESVLAARRAHDAAVASAYEPMGGLKQLGEVGGG